MARAKTSAAGTRDVVTLIGDRLDGTAEERTTQTPATVRRRDRDLTPAQMLVSRFVLPPEHAAVADDRAALVARTAECSPLAGCARAKARLDRDRIHERIFGDSLVLEGLLEQSSLAQLSGRELRRLERLDAVSLGSGHDRKRVPTRRARTITRATFGL